jgi:short-subunit dehydrogenase
MGQCNNCYSIVTGASQGLGLAFSEELAANGHNLILAALPNEGLQRIATNLSVKYNVKVEFFETLGL